MNTKNYEGFKAEFVQKVQEYFRESNYILEETVVEKFDQKLDAIIIRKPGSRIAPVFYVMDFFKAFEEHGDSIVKSIGHIEHFLENEEIPDTSFADDLTEYQKCQDNLIIQLINFEKNEEQLKKIPHRRLGDMAIIVNVLLDSSICQGTVLVDYDLVRIWNTDPEEVLAKAEKNMEKYPLRIIDLMPQNPLQALMMGGGPKIYVLTLESNFPGASAILREKKLQEFMEEQEKDFFILPASRHECLLVEDLGEPEFSSILTAMLASINEDQYNPSDVISNDLFYLERGKKLKLVEKSEFAL